MGNYQAGRRNSKPSESADCTVLQAEQRGYASTAARAELAVAPASRHGRLASLDAFRGLTIAAMMLVNSPGNHGAVYPQLKHAVWNGWTFADTVFPSFLFIMGVSLVFSLESRRENAAGAGDIESRIVKRTLILFALGLFINSFPIFHLSTLRIPGVLQRIALCYFFTSLIILKSSSIKSRIFWLFGLLGSYWLMMRFIPVPGIGAGMLEPGRNFASYIDSLFLSGHMWSYYGTWDPEGLISTIPAIATSLFGALTGYWLRSLYPGRVIAAGMLGAGIFLIVLGVLLDTHLPINKSIWTSTFSIFMAGIALCSFVPFYLLMDLGEYRLWARPLTILGVNPIAIYFLSEILDTSLRFIHLSLPNGYALSCRSYLFQSVCAPNATPEVASLLYGLGFVFSMFLIAWAMWRKRIFIKI